MAYLTRSTRAIKGKEIKRDWHLIDVSGKVLGRISPQIAKLLQGKHKVNYVPYLDAGDYVVVINAQKILLTGKKPQTKTYSQYSGYPGGLRVVNFKTLLEKNPGAVIKHAVSGMLPKNKLRDRRLSRLFIFADEKHPFEDKFKKS